MFFRSIRVGRLAGFDIEVNTSFLILLALVVIMQGFIAGLILALVVFGSVLLHELGHAVVARKLKVPIAGIELQFFGGVAKMAGTPRSARDEIKIAAAGPAVSFMLAGMGLLLLFLLPFEGLGLFAGVNLILGTFNLLPALPMDGGRIFRAILSKKMGRLKATEVAVKVTHGAAVLIGIGAAMTGNWHLVAIAIVIWMMGTRERQMARYWRYDGEAPEPDPISEAGATPGRWFVGRGMPMGNSRSQGEVNSTPFGIPNVEGSSSPYTTKNLHKTEDGGWVVVKKIQW